MDNYLDDIPVSDAAVLFSPTISERHMFQKFCISALIAWFFVASANAQMTEKSSLLPAGTPTVQLPSAEAMLKFCRNEKPGYQEICDGYLGGIAEFHDFVWMGQLEPIFCLPDGWTETTMRPAVVSYISSNFEDWQGRPALGAVIAALASRFPCH